MQFDNNRCCVAYVCCSLSLQATYTPYTIRHRRASEMPSSKSSRSFSTSSTHTLTTAASFHAGSNSSSTNSSKHDDSSSGIAMVACKTLTPFCKAVNAVTSSSATVTAPHSSPPLPRTHSASMSTSNSNSSSGSSGNMADAAAEAALSAKAASFHGITDTMAVTPL
jgi:hypothetical protein